jgi:hypothetical protein
MSVSLRRSPFLRHASKAIRPRPVAKSGRDLSRASLRSSRSTSRPTVRSATILPRTASSAPGSAPSGRPWALMVATPHWPWTSTSTEPESNEFEKAAARRCLSASSRCARLGRSLPSFLVIPRGDAPIGGRLDAQDGYRGYHYAEKRHDHKPPNVHGSVEKGLWFADREALLLFRLEITRINPCYSTAKRGHRLNQTPKDQHAENGNQPSGEDEEDLISTLGPYRLRHDKESAVGRHRVPSN